jgi:serine/threonine protein phosphatase 1
MKKGRRLAVGDIHGCIRTFRILLEEKMALHPNDALFLLGDYIDRGTDSKAVVDYILALQSDGYNIIPLMGNHEYMLVKAMNSNEFYKRWMLNAGFTTLRDFGIIEAEYKPPEAIFMIPDRYLDFFGELGYYEMIPGYFLCHGCFEGRPPDPLRDTDSMIWRRVESYNHEFLKGRILLHGHTPAPLRKIRERAESHESLIINLDGGCVYRNNPDLGHLVGMDLDTRQVYWVKNSD